MTRPIRLRTYLSPSLPLGLFRGLGRYLAESLDQRVRVDSDARFSGPPPDVEDPFSRDEIDFAFLCAPRFLELRAMDPPPVQLTPVALVPSDPRAHDSPIYFSDVVTRAGSSAHSFDDLEHRNFGYNDSASLSGYYSLLHRLRTMGRTPDFFAGLHLTGSHLRSLELVRSGLIDAAAIDSNVLRLRLAVDPLLESEIRVLESWGPFAIQPLVARAALPASLVDAVTEALLALHSRPAGARLLARHGFTKFSAIQEESYLLERATLLD